jgi:hypothetical protein
MPAEQVQKDLDSGVSIVTGKILVAVNIIKFI